MPFALIPVTFIAMDNIKFNYLYRDAANNETHGFMIFSNPQKLPISFIEHEMRKFLIDSEFFDPSEIEIPRLVHKDYSFDPELDHAWNEFDSIEETNEAANDKRNITEFLQVLSCIKSF